MEVIADGLSGGKRRNVIKAELGVGGCYKSGDFYTKPEDLCPT